jgi:hypothetical protein
MNYPSFRAMREHEADAGVERSLHQSETWVV